MNTVLQVTSSKRLKNKFYKKHFIVYWKEKNFSLECGMRETSQWIKYLVFNMRVRAWIPSSEWPVAPEGRATPWAKLAGWLD